MTTDVLLEVKLPSVWPEIDDSTDRWAFHSSAPINVDVAGVQTAILAFYTSIENLIGPAVDRSSGACSSSFYDIATHLDGSPHGPPFVVDNWTLGGPVGNQEPAQLAVVVDFHADLSGVSEFVGTTRPRSRLRGRHYLGPLAVGAVHDGTSSSDPPQLGSAWVAGLPSSYATFLSSVPTGTEWGVWSRKNMAIAPVIGGWVDRTIHTQRRVADPAGVKILWP